MLSPATALRSPAGTYTATMQADGNLVVATPAGASRWTSATPGAGNRLEVRADGNVVIVRTNGTVAWSSGTNGWTGGVLTLTDQGLLQVRRGTTTVWDHRGVRYDQMLPGQVLRPGESLVSTSQAWRLAMQNDGNLVLSSAQGKRQWAAFTSGSGSTARCRPTATSSSATAAASSCGRRRPAVPARSCVCSPPATSPSTRAPSSRGPSPRARAVGLGVLLAGHPGLHPARSVTTASARGTTPSTRGQQLHELLRYRLSRDGVQNPGNLGNANTWDDYARAKGFAVDQSPRVGDIAQWNSNHVAYVDWVSADGNTVAISESGYGGTVLGNTYTSMSGRRIIARSSYSWPSKLHPLPLTAPRTPRVGAQPQ